jgi:Flp pilus assembly protein TadD
MRLALQVSALTLAALSVTGCSVFHTANTQPQEAKVTLRVADAALAAGEPEIALRVATIVLDRQPGNVAAMVAKGDALYAMGDTDQARETYVSAVAADPDSVGAQMGLGRTLVRTAPQDAEAHFLAALAKQPDNAIALNNLGIARDLQGRHEQAQETYHQALALDPDQEDVKTNLRLSLELSGQPVHAAQEATAQYDTPAAPISSVDSEPIQQIAQKPTTEPPSQEAEASQGGIYVQMASSNTERGARDEWQQLRARWPDLLGGHMPAVQQADVKDRTVWRLRTGGFASVSDANDFCQKLRATGTGCWTVAANTRN